MENSKQQEIPKAVIGIIFLIQILLLLWVGWENRGEVVDADAVSYIRIAQYYASGQFNLMVSGYWAPLLSWMIAPLLGLIEDPFCAAQIAVGVSAMVYLLGCIALLRALGLGATAMIVGAGIVVLFSVRQTVVILSPDLLMSGILFMAISRLLDPTWCEKPSVQLSAGLLFGAAYLAKAPALPFSFLLIFAASAIWIIKRRTSLPRVIGSVTITVLGLILLAGPWILVLSYKYGGPVFSTSAQINHTLIGPSNVERFHPTFRTFHIPEKGRITSWEVPSTLSYPHWSPLDSASNLKHQVWIVRSNAKRIFHKLQNFDWLGLGPVAVLLGFLFHIPWRDTSSSNLWRWTGAFILCLISVYLPVQSVETRYFLQTYPFLLAGSLGFMLQVAETASPQLRLFKIIGISLVALSFLAAQGIDFPSQLKPEYQVAKALTQTLRSLNVSGPIASTRSKGKIALYTAFLMGVPCYGVDTAAQTVEEVGSSLAKIIVVERGTLVDQNLKNDKTFIRLEESMFHSFGKDFDLWVNVYINTAIDHDRASTNVTPPSM